MPITTHWSLAGLVLAVGVAACEPPELPDPSSPTYAEAVGAFYRGIAAAQAGEGEVAVAAFQRLTELVPREPAGWANLGLIALQRRELEQAAASVEEARRLAPTNGRIHLLSALVERERGQLDSAAAYLRRAIELDSRDLRALYLLAQLVEQEARFGSAAEALQLIDRLLALESGNLVALLERTRLAASMGDLETLRQTLDRLEARAESLSVPLTAELRSVRTAAEAGAMERAATQVAFVQAALQPLPAYRDDEDAVVTSPGHGEVLLTHFVRLPTPSAQPAPPDTAFTFEAEPLAVAEGALSWVQAVWLSEEVPLALVAANGETVWVSPAPGQVEAIAFPGRASAVAPLDYDYDFRMDLVLVGPGGLRLLRQVDADAFTDVTTEAVPAAVAGAAYAGVWAADLDLEGDLDLVLARIEGAPIVLRNLGDGRFAPTPTFTGVTRLRDFAWADLDADGDPDAASLDAEGRLQVFLSQRSDVPPFQPRPLPDTLGAVHAIAAADLNQDATLELILLGADGTLRRLSLDQGRWETAALAQWPDFSSAGAGSTRLFLPDLDNNGALDVVASTAQGARVWLSTEHGLRPHRPVEIRVTDVADLGGAGRVDLIGVSPNGTPWVLANQGARDYYSTSIRPRAAEVTGDRRINSFGVGGEIEIRAGLLYQKQLIRGPSVHFGLGTHPQVDVARIVWPNGTVQAGFNLSATNQAMLTRQQLKGSCPWVFTFDGEGMQFVTDFLWRTALGLRINAQGDAAVIHSEDWIKIRGDQLAARDGFFDVRITAELWETHFFDHVALMVVDHPETTEVFVDEGFRLPAPEPAVRAMQRLRPVAWARNQVGRDVTAAIQARDQRFVDTFELGPYQGVAAEHFLEVALGDEAPVEGPLWLVASGWVYPTDASINVAISQGKHATPHGLELEVPDGRGGWITADPNLGFPAGKTKTMLIDLRSVFRPGTERRLRLRTNLEVYWDHIAWAVGVPDAPVVTRRLLPEVAELRYRGFSRVSQAGRRAPELPDYHRIATGAPVWRDLVGFYTRFGDVRPLNQAVDDRYTIMNAGDELALRFAAPAPPEQGWTRDFVLIGDGWVKDGDYNTGFSTTVLPLPYHGMPDYARPPGRVEDDPAYRRHPEDWHAFHTRYVTPRGFHRALITGRDP